MKTEKEIKEIKSNINYYLKDGLFKKIEYDHLTEFYLENAKKSLATSEALKQLSNDVNLKKLFNLLDDFETYLWVITTSYYSMFYAVNALFSKNGIKIGDKIAHKVTSDVFYFYFIKNNKIAKRLFEIYEEIKDEALDLTDNKYIKVADELSNNLDFEREKRHKFQYNMLESIKKSYAETSLKRAIEFVNQIEVIIKS
ncbi:MAG: hypothetical protein V1663_00460 [archaeon]